METANFSAIKIVKETLASAAWTAGIVLQGRQAAENMGVLIALPAARINGERPGSVPFSILQLFGSDAKQLFHLGAFLQYNRFVA